MYTYQTSINRSKDWCLDNVQAMQHANWKALPYVKFPHTNTCSAVCLISILNINYLSNMNFSLLHSPPSRPSLRTLFFHTFKYICKQFLNHAAVDFNHNQHILIFETYFSDPNHYKKTCHHHDKNLNRKKNFLNFKSLYILSNLYTIIKFINQSSDSNSIFK